MAREKEAALCDCYKAIEKNELAEGIQKMPISTKTDRDFNG